MGLPLSAFDADNAFRMESEGSSRSSSGASCTDGTEDRPAFDRWVTFDARGSLEILIFGDKSGR